MHKHHPCTRQAKTGLIGVNRREPCGATGELRAAAPDADRQVWGMMPPWWQRASVALVSHCLATTPTPTTPIQARPMTLDHSTDLTFAQADLAERLDTLDDAGLHALGFGVIAFDAQCIVRRYGAFESAASGLLPERVVGLHLFDVVAQCMNNYLVAQRFEDAAREGVALDATIDYVLTLRVRPVPVRLRLMARPAAELRFLAIERLV
jgi:photoactive yellow protein